MLDKQDLQAIGNLIDEKLDAKLAQTEKRIIHAVGEMLEDNVFPQFEEVHRELRRLNTLVAQR